MWCRLERRSACLTLTDFSPAMCGRLRSVPDARVVRCDAARLPLGAASFGTVVANHMLYHLDDPDAALAEFARVLRRCAGRSAGCQRRSSRRGYGWMVASGSGSTRC
ncbi:class I SAM-dependent methyltransferase [Paractinoplanes rishiriensis]|uniref:class I SAM-dependent methyltransferase n=1 Tax=Paractinoplanes rishiriensis TaxID=1050105 RepID=UPI001EF1CAAE|nr:class I SAM-dependent methyltransferase [Actinoplanes rishiriensis]